MKTSIIESTSNDQVNPSHAEKKRCKFFYIY